MNHNKIMKFTHSKSKVQWWTIVAIFGIIITFTACNKDDDDMVVEPPPPEEEYPALKVVNQNTDDRVITAVKLVGYEFYTLNIESSDSQTFILEDGMPGGYDDINVTVNYKRGNSTGSKSIQVNFTDGDTTTVTLKGCISFEGCNGFYLE